MDEGMKKLLIIGGSIMGGLLLIILVAAIIGGTGSKNLTYEEFENRLQEEIFESGCEDEEDYLNYLCDLESPIEWFLSNFSQNEFNITDIHWDK